MSNLSHLSKVPSLEEFDPNGGADLMTNALKGKLGAIDPNKLEEVRREIAASAATSKEGRYIDEYLGRTKPASPSEEVKPKKLSLGDISAEDILVDLYSIYDGMVDIFQRIGLNHEVSNLFTEQIDMISGVIRKLGGTVEDFVPEDHVSGLELPPTYENALKVVERTINCYKIGEVTDHSIEDDGETIRITFSGGVQLPSGDNVKYVAAGVVRASKRGWTGAEAIDYIYRPGRGKMLVRAIENGKWVTKSDNFEIRWELEEFTGEQPPEESVNDDEDPVEIDEIVDALTPKGEDLAELDDSEEFRP